MAEPRRLFQAPVPAIHRRREDHAAVEIASLRFLLGGNVSVQGVESGQGEGGRLAVSPAPLNLRAANVACGGRGCGSQAYSCCCEFGLFTHPHSPGGDRRVV